MILQLLKHGLVQHYHDPLLAGHHDLQELAKTYHQVTMARKRLADSLLNHYLPLYFPRWRGTGSPRASSGLWPSYRASQRHTRFTLLAFLSSSRPHGR